MPKEFCIAYGMNTLGSYSVRLYGEVAAALLARAWCHNMDHFFNMWEQQDNWSYEFTGEDMTSYMPSEEYIAFFMRLSVDDPATSRAQQLNNTEFGKPQWAFIPP